MDQHTSASLCGLPQELVEAIVPQLTQPFRNHGILPSRLADLSRLNRTCKRLRLATLGALYENITMLWKADVYNPCEMVRNPRIDLLLRTLLEVPESANRISKINLQATGMRNTARRGDRWGKPKFPASKSTASHTARVRQALLRLGLEGTEIGERMSAKLVENDFDAVVALVVMLCTGITDLTLGIDILLANPFRSIILGSALPIQTSSTIQFQHLRVLKLGGWFDQREDERITYIGTPEVVAHGFPSFHTYYPVLFLPRLEYVEISLPRADRIKPSKLPTLLQPKLSTLTSMRLLEFSVPPRPFLRTILLATPCLRHVEFDYCMFPGDSFDPTAIGAALDAVKNTLTELRVKARVWPDERGVFPAGFDLVPEFCSLRNMRALNKVSIPSFVLLGWNPPSPPSLAEVLPPNIVNLRIQADCAWFEGFAWTEKQLMSQLQEFLEGQQWKLATPRLQHIDVLYGRWTNSSALHELCSRNGLSCAVGPQYPDFPHWIDI